MCACMRPCMCVNCLCSIIFIHCPNIQIANTLILDHFYLHLSSPFFLFFSLSLPLSICLLSCNCYFLHIFHAHVIRIIIFVCMWNTTENGLKWSSYRALVCTQTHTHISTIGMFVTCNVFCSSYWQTKDGHTDLTLFETTLLGGPTMLVLFWLYIIFRPPFLILHSSQNFLIVHLNCYCNDQFCQNQFIPIWKSNENYDMKNWS